MKNKLPIALITAFILTLSWVFAAEDVSMDLTSNIVRLHIIANSDSVADQTLKLAVRDRVLAEANSTSSLLTDEELLAACKDEIKQKGYTYPVAIERGRFYFPRKVYNNLTLPAGNYHAVRIVIGQGSGQNWWCVMYPPLCFTQSSLGTITEDAQKQLQDMLEEQTLSMICESDRITIKPAFKLVELWQEIKANGLPFPIFCKEDA
ncbi:MAG: stage II sporulation protein R [Ruminococcaceae bacterium]|nr:stage II sporulation protein R [Oscillospiraceae bacterium]